MELKLELLINKYGQDIINNEILLSIFNNFDSVVKKEFLNDFLFLICQSKPLNADIDVSINESGLKSTYTPCVLLKKGLNMSNLQKIINLPENELSKAFLLLLSLFRIAYRRRFLQEKNNPNKWWYWDLSDQKNIDKVLLRDSNSLDL